MSAALAQSRVQQMLHAPLLSTLFRLATPNVMGLFAATIVIGYDGYILGRVGADALAGIALVFPLSMLMLQMSAGGIGGATTAAVARALGAGRGEDASRLAQQALLISAALAALFMLVLLGFGRPIFSGMGGRGAALEAALAYSNVLFSGALIIWFTNVLAAVVRGAGNMVLPSVLLLGTALLHLALCPLLVFGWGPWPGLGVAGAAVSTLVVNALSAVVMVVHLLRRDGAVHLQRAPWRPHGPLLRDILRVGLPASMSPVISNASIAVATALVGSYGTAALAGYGVAARLEYILVPIAFGFGTALTAMVATNMGAGQSARAVRVAWVGGAVVAAITGTIGLVAAVAPALWMGLFTTDAEVLALGATYLNIVGGGYAFFGLGLALFFASQGAGRMFWPLAGSMGRLVILLVGGWLCVHVFKTPASALFAVVALSLVAYGSTLAIAIRLGSWTR
ncbi:MATE family efflux transporter [Hydrogenophaga sp. PBL-H3]|uniref:MATE family efflux transporter n=1 Tax=Hydrogenophaga sp. PBL-H3 TaxID=434010 RepID=UPI00131FE2AA|nr:MATE family efflux transporter [Hydrogenophaga sp. PBL-H3]QHE78045.1 MATE family efflux transporter [Hydrogenophaga sp. PBL-H3]QHE82470.1 MATE family efflux transporter [Hydrogenophaga sp. PBL-H3]